MTGRNNEHPASVLIELLQSPFVDAQRPRLQSDELLRLYDPAFRNRVALLLLDRYKDMLAGEELLERYSSLLNRQKKTLEVISRVARVMNDFDPSSYVVFKSLKPYLATPNDTDVLFFEDASRYELAYQKLLDSGYQFHEWAPQQRTVYDPEGSGKIGAGKKGGTYYIDFYQEISTDYFAYFNKKKLRPYVLTKDIEGVRVNVLRPEPELAIILFHNVFPERTFQLEHFYVTLYSVASKDFDLNFFIEFVQEHHMSRAIRTNFSIIGHLHRQYFSTVPEAVQTVLDQLGVNSSEVARFVRSGAQAPYLFSQGTFWVAFAQKAMEPYCFRSLLVQAVKMLNPKFFLDVMRSLRRRLSERGVYHAE